MYLTGLVVFAVASVLAGAAPSGELLIAARVLQGVGGAMILPSTQSILNTNFRGRDRAIAFGIWGATIGGMAAVGPLHRRLADHLPDLALGLLHQHPDRGDRVLRHAPLHQGVEGRARQGGPRPGGVPAHHARPGRVRVRPDRGPHLRLVGADRAVHPVRLDLATREHLHHPGRDRVRPGGAGPVLRRRGPAVPRRQVLPVRRGAVALQGVPLRQPGGQHRLARRVRPPVRAAPVPPGRRRLLGVRDRPRVPGAGHGRVRRGPDWPPASRTAGARGGR